MTISTCITHDTETVFLPVLCSDGVYNDLQLEAERCKLCGGLFWVGGFVEETPVVEARGGDQ